MGNTNVPFQPNPMGVSSSATTPPTLTPQDSAIVGTPADNLQYVIAILVMALLGVVAVVGITLSRPHDDNSILITAVLGFLAPTTLSLLSFMKSEQTHISVNSRLDSFLKTAQAAALNQGVAQGIIQGTDAANARTDQLKNN